MDRKGRQQVILDEVSDKYSEWFETAGDEAPALYIHILAGMIIHERDENIYLKKRLENAAPSSTK